MPNNFLNDTTSKNSLIKREILRLCIDHTNFSIADFSKNLGISVPTITKLLGELIEEGFLQDLGKLGTSGGRRPSVFGLNPEAGYFVGVDVARHHFHIAVCDFKGELVKFIQDIEFVLEASQESFRNMCRMVKDEITGSGIPWFKVLGVGVSLSGRVNPEKGYSLTYSNNEDFPLKDLFQKEFNVPVTIENDSRAMTYGEYMTLGQKADKDMVFINLSWGLGMGMILDGKLYYGKSGYSGEIGHFPLLDNNVICRCGKVGCLETGASGSALHSMMVDMLKSGRQSSLSKSFSRKGDIELEEILQAIGDEDVLAIECIGKIGRTLGRGIAGVINIFNPGLVVIGGRLIVGKEYLLLPIKTEINKLSLHRVSSDSEIVLSELGRRAASVGDCLLSRSKILGLM
ncbi:MAG: ROK family protein [Bacteroidales bacterium]|nr:ROK family protein [Bacteroidales bacterium]